MNILKKFFCLFILAAGYFCLILTKVWSAELTNNNYDDWDPDIHNGQVVWSGFDGNDYEIFLYDGTQVKKLTDNYWDDYSPQIHNGLVAWQGYDGNDWEVFLWDGIQVKKLTNNNNDDWDPQIDNGQVVWEGWDGNDEEIFLYNGSQTIQLTNNTDNDYSPRIHNGQVAWKHGDGSGVGDIFLYSGSSTSQLTGVDISYVEWPDIHNGQVVWCEDLYKDGAYYEEIMLYDGAQTRRITYNDYNEFSPKIHNGQITWEADIESKDLDIYIMEIFLYDGARVIQLTNSGRNAGPQIDNGQVVWSGYDGNDWEIFFYDGLQVKQLTNNNYDDWAVSIHNGQVVGEMWDGNDYEIFLDTYGIKPIKIPLGGSISGETEGAMYKVYIPDPYGGTLTVKTHKDADLDLYYPDTETKLVNVDKKTTIEEEGGIQIQKLKLTYEIPFKDSQGNPKDNHGWYYVKVIKKPQGVSSFEIENTFIQIGEVPEERKPWNISTWWPFSDVNDDGLAVKPIIHNLYDDNGPLRKYDLAVYGSEFTPATDWEKGKSYLETTGKVRGTKGHYFYNGIARETYAEKDFKFDWDLDKIIEDPGPYDFFNSSTGGFGRGKGDSDLNDTFPLDWWGHCDGWAQAAIIFKNPTNLILKGDFTVEDTKGFFAETGMRELNIDKTDKINKRTINDDDIRKDDKEWTKVFHEFLRYWLKKEQKAIYGNLKHTKRTIKNFSDVWNHPIWFYAAEMKERNGDEKLVDVILTLKAADDLGRPGYSFREDSDRTFEEKKADGGYGAQAWRYHLKYDEKGKINTEGCGWDTVSIDDPNIKYYIPYLVHPKSEDGVFISESGRSNPYVTEDKIKSFVVDGKIRRDVW